jgi:hypothetical protein
MPDSAVPAWARYLLRTLQAVAGILAIVLGLGDLYSPSVVVTYAAGSQLVAAWAWACVVAGSLLVVSVLWDRWRWELVLAAVLVVALGTRATAVWLTIDEGYRLGAAAGTSLAGLLFLLRSVELMAFGVRASAAPWARRKVARDGGV